MATIILNIASGPGEYKVGYRVKDSMSAFTYVTPNPTSSVITIPGLSYVPYEIRVAGVCEGEETTYQTVFATPTITATVNIYGANQVQVTLSEPIACNFTLPVAWTVEDDMTFAPTNYTATVTISAGNLSAVTSTAVSGTTATCINYTYVSVTTCSGDIIVEVVYETGIVPAC